MKGVRHRASERMSWRKGMNHRQEYLFTNDFILCLLQSYFLYEFMTAACMRKDFHFNLLSLIAWRIEKLSLLYVLYYCVGVFVCILRFSLSLFFLGGEKHTEFTSHRIAICWWIIAFLHFLCRNIVRMKFFRIVSMRVAVKGEWVKGFPILRSLFRCGAKYILFMFCWIKFIFKQWLECSQEMHWMIGKNWSLVLLATFIITYLWKREFSSNLCQIYFDIGWMTFDESTCFLFHRFSPLIIIIVPT